MYTKNILTSATFLGFILPSYGQPTTHETYLEKQEYISDNGDTNTVSWLVLGINVACNIRYHIIVIMHTCSINIINTASYCCYIT